MDQYKKKLVSITEKEAAAADNDELIKITEAEATELIKTNKDYNNVMWLYLKKFAEVFLTGDKNLEKASLVFKKTKENGEHGFTEEHGFKLLGLYALTAHGLLNETNEINANGDLSPLAFKNYRGIKNILPIFTAPIFLWDRQSNPLGQMLVEKYIQDSKQLDEFYIKLLTNVMNLFYNL